MAKKTSEEKITAANAGEIVSKSDITVSSLTTNLAFNEKVTAVDSALTTRSAAKKQIKTAWAKVIVILQEFDMDVPARRWDAVNALNQVRNLKVYEPLDKRLDDKERVQLATNLHYEFERVLESRKFIDYLDGKFYGLKKDLLSLQELYDLSTQSRKIDEAKTKAGQDRLRSEIRNYIDAIEAYDETVESVADVREYISVVKDVAEISAIASGNIPNNSN